MKQERPTPLFQLGWLGRGPLAWFVHFFGVHIWTTETGRSGWLRVLYRPLRVMTLAIRHFVMDRCMFQASALTYVTFLSLAPLLALSFSVAKALGAYEKLRTDVIEPFLTDAFGPAGGEDVSEVRAVIENVLDMVNETDFSGIAFFGGLVLIYAVIKLLGNVERSFNEIWKIKKSRTFLRKVSDYLTLVVITPILLVTAAGLIAALRIDRTLDYLRNTMVIGPAVEFLMLLASPVGVWIGFTVVYLTLPNTRMRFSAAFLGGVIGGTLWVLVQFLHVRFQVGIANWNPIYASFAAIPIFLVWIYMSWVTVLFGAETSFAFRSEPNWRLSKRAVELDHRDLETLSLRALVRIGQAFARGEDPLGAEKLAGELEVPEEAMVSVLAQMVEQDILIAADGDVESRVVPVHDLKLVTVDSVLGALRSRAGSEAFPVSGPVDLEVERVLEGLHEESRTSRFNLTIQDLVQAAEELRADPGLSGETPAGAALPATDP